VRDEPLTPSLALCYSRIRPSMRSQHALIVDLTGIHSPFDTSLKLLIDDLKDDSLETIA